MDRLEAMTILLSAVEAGSLSAASRQLRIPLATVSRRVSELEEHLKIRLFLRGNRTLRLTDAGRVYVASCRRIVDDIADAERTAAGEYHAPQGELIISVPPVIGCHHVVPIAVEFLRTYPDIRMRVELGERHVNLLEEHVHLALRVGELPDSDMIVTRIALIRRVLCASPAYLKDRGVPQSPDDLQSHDCVGWAGDLAGVKWAFRSEGVRQTIRISSRLAVNSGDAAVIAATAGAGITRAWSFQIDALLKSGSLVTLLEPYEPPPVPVNFIYPGQRQVPLKLRAFLDFSLPRLKERLGA